MHLGNGFFCSLSNIDVSMVLGVVFVSQTDVCTCRAASKLLILFNILHYILYFTFLLLCFAADSVCAWVQLLLQVYILYEIIRDVLLLWKSRKGNKVHTSPIHSGYCFELDW